MAASRFGPPAGVRALLFLRSPRHVRGQAFQPPKLGKFAGKSNLSRTSALLAAAKAESWAKQLEESMHPIANVCVYCGSQPGSDSLHMREAGLLGNHLARAGIGLVYGGGEKGIMGAVARGVLEGGGRVTGVIPQFLLTETSRDWLDGLSEAVLTQDMHERKHAMFERADAFIALPGGIGTLEELVEVMTWAQLGRHRKPIVIANFAGFWDKLLELVDHMRAQGFIHTSRLVQPLVARSAGEIVPLLTSVMAKTRGDLSGEEEIIDRL
jgi:uncharacterized protein (TIGR00730 family)